MPNDPAAEVLTHYLDFDMRLDEEEEVSLPLFHNCTQDNLVRFLLQERIEADLQPCNVFNERIVYTFYGAAKFVKMDPKPNASQGDATACIVLDSSQCTDVYRIYPIDTGVFSGKTPDFRPALLKWETIKAKLNLGERIDRINKMALCCFENLKDYVDGKVNSEMNGKAVEVKAKYSPPKTVSQFKDTHNLMLDQSFADERRYCYEVQFFEEVKLIPQNVLHIIAFSGLLKDAHFKLLVKKYRVPLKKSLFYPTSVISNYSIGEWIKEASKKYTKANFLNGKG